MTIRGQAARDLSTHGPRKVSLRCGIISPMNENSAKAPTWIKILVAGARGRAKERGMAFDLTEADVLAMWETQSGRCYWFGVPLQWRDDLAVARHPSIPSLDRVDSNRGYVVGNVVLSCWGANAAKGTCSPDEWEEFLGYLRVGLIDRGQLHAHS